MSFDRLLNSNCSWSYKTMKTVTLEAKKGNNSLFKLQNTNITENCVEKEGDSCLNSETFNEFENISDVNESEKSILNDGAEENEGLTGHDCIPDSPYDCVISDENESIYGTDERVSSIHKSKTSIKKSLKNTERKSYVGSGVRSIDTSDASIKSLKNAGRKFAAKSEAKSIKSKTSLKKSLKNTEHKISTRSNVRSIDTPDARVINALNNTEHNSYAESDLESVDMSDSSIKISSKNTDSKTLARSYAKSINTSDARIEKAFQNTDSKISAGLDARSKDTYDAIARKALKNAERTSNLGSDLESIDMSDSSIKISSKNTHSKSFARSDAKIIDTSDSRIEKALQNTDRKGYAGSDAKSIDTFDARIEKASKDTNRKSSAGSDVRSIDKSDASVKVRKNTERKSYAGSDLESVDMSDVSIKNNLRNAVRKNYAESDIKSDAYSSSDEEAVLQTRICNEEGKAISNVPADNSNHVGEQIDSFRDNNENLNSLCFDHSDHSNLENDEAFDKFSGKQENGVIHINDNNSIVKPQVLNCKDTSQLEKSFSKKRDPKKKFAEENSSFEFSSLSEAGDANDETVNGVYLSSSNEMKMHRESKTDSEIIQRCLDISTEVHSMCDTMESRETSTLNEIVHDFFNGTFDVGKYEINKISPTVSKESYETIQNGEKTTILNRDKETSLSVTQTPDSFIINTDLYNGKVSESPVKSVKRKSLQTKQTLDKDLKKRTPNSLKLSNNYFNDKQKSKELSAKKPNRNQSFNSKLATKIRSENTLFHKDQNLKKSLRNDEYDETDEFTISYSPERPLFSESIEMHTKKNSLKRKSPSENVRQGNCSRVKQLSNNVSTNIDTNYKNQDTYKQLIKTKKSQPPEIVKTSTTKSPKTWDDLENLYSEETIYHTNSLLLCQDEPVLISKKPAFLDEPVVSFPKITNTVNKKARLRTHTENEYPDLSSSPQNRCGAFKNQITTLTPKNTSKRNNELALVSPNANMLDKIMKNMEKCTQPYTCSSKKKQSTLLNDLGPNNDNNKSPMVTEYSYSIKEIQSTILVTSGKTKKKIRNVVHRDETKSQFCKVAQQKSLPSKNCQIKNQETAFKSWSLLKDNYDNFSNKKNLNTPLRTPNKFLNKESGSKEDTKPNVLNNILARLEVGDYTHDNGRNNNCVDAKQTKLITHKSNKNKETPDLESSISTINTFSVEQGHYNLRKRKFKNNNLDEFEHDQNNKKLSIYAECDSANTASVAKHSRSNTKLRMDWNDENTDATDSSCEIIYIPNQKREERKIHRNTKKIEVGKFKTLSSKPENSHKSLDKKKATQSGKKESVLLPDTSMLSNNSEESDSEGTIYEFNNIKTREINNKTRTNVKRRLLSEEDIPEKSSSERGWENFDYPKKSYPQSKRNPNKNQLKIADNPNSNKKKYVNTKKTEAFFMPYQNSSNCNGSANFDGKKKLARNVDETRNNTLQKKEAFIPTEISPQCSNKNPTNKTQDLHFGKEQNFSTYFTQEPKKSSPNLQIRTSSKKMTLKCNNKDSYKKYLETIFKNSNKTSTHQSTSSRNQMQKFRESALIEDSDEFFSLSSSADSDDLEASTPSISLGLLGDILCESEEE